MSSSSKRSFEEAISPIGSPSSASDSTLQRHEEEGASRGFTSSLSHSFDSIRRNHDTTSSLSNISSQITRRRVPHKRRRAAIYPSALSESNSPETLDELMQHVQEDSAIASAAGVMHADTTASNSTALEEMSQTWSSLQRSLVDTEEPTEDHTELPSGTPQLLRRWWVDSEEPTSSGSISGSNRSTVAETGSDQGTVDVHAGRNESAQMSPSSTVSVSGSVPSSHSVLRRLQLREREEEEDVQLQDTTSEEVQTSDYHDQLMDVFRRMNDRSSQNSVLPRPPLRSTTMMRSTTQLSDALSRSNSQMQEDTVDNGSDLGDIISSYLEPEDAVNQRQTSSTMLPSARAFTSERAQVRSTQASLSNRVASLQARNNTTTFHELARRNQEVLERYSNPASRVRPRHTGSPTFPPLEAERETTDEALGAGSEARESAESIFHYRPPSSRRPARGSSILPNVPTQRDIESDAPLWGEYLLSRGPQRRILEPVALEESNSTPVNAAESTNEASQYLSRLSDRLSSSNTASSTTARRRVGALDSSGRIRGPTRSQNEIWLGMSTGGETDEAGSGSIHQLRRAMQYTPSMEEQERVMSTYRQMSFPDPESSVGTPSTQQERHTLLNRPPQLPSLRSRSPFELPFVNAAETVTPSSSSEQVNTSNRSENLEALASGRDITRPHLRPLTLSSRLGSSLSHRSQRREQDTANTLTSERPPMPNFRLSDTASERTENLLDRPTRRTDELRDLMRERNDIIMDPLDLSSHRRRRRSQFDAEQRDTPSQTDLDSAASLHLSRRLPVHSLSINRSLRQRSGLHNRRRPTLLESDSSAVDMELPNRDRFDLDSLMASTREDALRRQEEQRSNSRIAPLTLSSSSSRPAPRRPLNRWDRYMDEASSSIGIRSIMEAQAQEQHFSSSSFFSSLSRLPGGSLASTLHSEIATNPANYVADDDFALRDTYEGLLQLSAQIGDVRCKSTPAHVIAKLPSCLYTHWLGGSCKTSSLDLRNHGHSDMDTLCGSGRCSSPEKGKAKARESDMIKDTSCSICLESYAALDTVMSLPCNHAFHEDCLTTWLKTARSCPCCRGDVCVDEPSSTKTTSSSLRMLPELYF
jgi:hypothetical protein